MHPDAFFETLSMFKIKLGLDDVYQLMALLRNPQDQLKIIHLAGTNGKGSTLVFLENLLIEQGFRVCSTISPHLIDLKERFRYQKNSIEESEFVGCFREIQQLLGMDAPDRPENWKIQPSYFELAIALFFYWAKQKKPDYVLLETGLGGKLDATNVAPNIQALITPISLDHQEFLGDSVEKILYDKLGIVKKGSKLFLGNQSPEVRQAFQNYPLDPSVRCYKAGEDFFWKSPASQPDKKIFCFPAKIDQSYADQNLAFRTLGLAGRHQWDNALLALASFFDLIEPKKTVRVAEALETAFWPARLQHLPKLQGQAAGKGPEIWIDGAHNQAGVESLLYHIEQNWQGKKILLAITWMADKKLDQFLRLPSTLDLLPIDFDYPRAVSPQKIREAFPHALAPKTPAGLVEALKTHQYDDYAIVLISGSLYFAGKFLELWQPNQG